MQPHYATQFQQLLLAGDWEGTLNLLPTLTADEEVSKDVKIKQGAYDIAPQPPGQSPNGALRAGAIFQGCQHQVSGTLEPEINRGNKHASFWSTNLTAMLQVIPCPGLSASSFQS
eukprot:1158347-Pelagomonas_calceolata.AAC.4